MIILQKEMKTDTMSLYIYVQTDVVFISVSNDIVFVKDVHRHSMKVVYNAELAFVTFSNLFLANNTHFSVNS